MYVTGFNIRASGEIPKIGNQKLTGIFVAKFSESASKKREELATSLGLRLPTCRAQSICRATKITRICEFNLYRVLRNV